MGGRYWAQVMGLRSWRSGHGVRSWGLGLGLGSSEVRPPPAAVNPNPNPEQVMGALQAGGKRQTEKVLQSHAEALKGWLPPSELCPAFTAEDLDFLEVRCSEI